MFGFIIVLKLPRNNTRGVFYPCTRGGCSCVLALGTPPYATDFGVPLEIFILVGILAFEFQTYYIFVLLSKLST